MAKAIGLNYPMGAHRRKALIDNLNMIGKALDFNHGVKKAEFLKVA
jgi:hypothetical protein